MQINIPDDIAQRLEKLAEEQGGSVTDVLQNLLEQHAPAKPSATLADLARNAREANLASEHLVDTADRSRDILKNAYADYLKSHMDDDQDVDSDGQ